LDVGLAPVCIGIVVFAEVFYEGVYGLAEAGDILRGVVCGVVCCILVSLNDLIVCGIASDVEIGFLIVLFWKVEVDVVAVAEG